jgi:serine/threonine protein kinase
LAGSVEGDKMSAPDEDDEKRTVIRPRSPRSAAAPLGHTLPTGTYLRDYEITGLIGEGGFGIVYLAWDHSLQRKVAIKEYMPASMASRVAGSSAIVVKSERHLDTFKAGLKSFVNEARLLARFDHASLVKVYRFWEENGTAYMAMPFYEGPTLKTALAELGHAPSEAELRAWLNPLLDALTVMHAAQCFHRDIAPDNILLTSAGPLLLDFGAARRVIGDMTHALTVVLKPGYAPIEQYGDVASMSQGAWTDIYALACVVYYAITGKTPMSSVERLMDDRLEPLAVTAAGRYGDGFLRAIDAALAVKPQDRPQTEARFRALLDAGLPDGAPAPPSSGYGTLSHEAFAPTEQRGYSTVPGTLTPELATQLLARTPEPPTRAAPAAADQAVPPTELRTQISPRPDDPPWQALPEPGPAARTAPAAGKRQGAMLGLALVLVAAGLGMGAYFWMQPRSAGGAVPVEPAASAAVVPALAPSAPSVVSAPIVASAPALPTAPASAAAIPVAPPTQIDVPAPVASTAAPASAAASTPVGEVKPPPRVRREPPAETRPAAPRHTGGGSRCSDILQKASLEPLTGEEAAYLKRECR